MIKLFSQRLKKERLKKELTQQELADILNIDKSTICKYENGYSLPSIERSIQISNYFNISLDYLMGITDIRKQASLPPYLQDLLSKENYKYLKVAQKLKEENISLDILDAILNFYSDLQKNN